MRKPVYWLFLIISAATAVFSCASDPPGASHAGHETTDDALIGVDPSLANAAAMLVEGRRTFRYDTFGDEDFWGGTLRLHDALKGAARGGVGPGVTPRTALAVGLKVDATALPPAAISALKKGTLDLDSSETTLTLLRANAVVGVTGFFGSANDLTSLGIQCAFCHSTVDDSVAPGIGRRRDGAPNRDLDVGAIVGLSPDLSALASVLAVSELTVRSVLASWGPGKFDASLLLDGKNAPTLIPPAYGLAGVNMHTFTGWGSVSHWNALVATVEMHGKGTFFDPRLDDASKYPVAARTGAGHLRASPDLVSPKLAALQFYQLALPAPKPAPGSYDAPAAARGKAVFDGAAKCATCHVPPLFTEPGYNLHAASEIGIDDAQASRSPERRYRTAPLRGVATHGQGGYYHDGRFATLEAVVDHYDVALGLGLGDGAKADLAEYLRSL